MNKRINMVILLTALIGSVVLFSMEEREQSPANRTDIVSTITQWNSDEQLHVHLKKASYYLDEAHGCCSRLEEMKESGTKNLELFRSEIERMKCNVGKAINSYNQLPSDMMTLLNRKNCVTQEEFSNIQKLDKWPWIAQSFPEIVKDIKDYDSKIKAFSYDLLIKSNCVPLFMLDVDDPTLKSSLDAYCLEINNNSVNIPGNIYTPEEEEKFIALFNAKKRGSRCHRDLCRLDREIEHMEKEEAAEYDKEQKELEKQAQKKRKGNQSRNASGPKKRKMSQSGPISKRRKNHNS